MEPTYALNSNLVEHTLHRDSNRPLAHMPALHLPTQLPPMPPASLPLARHLLCFALCLRCPGKRCGGTVPHASMLQFCQRRLLTRDLRSHALLACMFVILQSERKQNASDHNDNRTQRDCILPARCRDEEPLCSTMHLTWGH